MTSEPIDRIAAHCRRHDLLRSGQPLLCLVSGGADSLMLMHAMVRLHDGPVGVLTIDHGLRADAPGEVAQVARWARELGCRVHIEHLGMDGGAALQERARDARWACARRIAQEHGYAQIATGHTASDQAETILFRLARGTGRDGALGMAVARDGVIRPLMAIARDEVRDWCSRQGLTPIDDPSNTDRRHARPRVRHDLIPALEAIHPDAQRHLGAFSDRLADEAALLAPLVDEAWGRIAADGALRVAVLRQAPPPLARMVLRRWLAAVGAPGRAAESATVERLRAMLESGRAIVVPGGIVVRAQGGMLRAEGPAAVGFPAVPLDPPGRARAGALVVCARRGPAPVAGPWAVGLRDTGPLVVRPARPGDRVALSGGGRRAVGRLLADAGVPRERRGDVAVVATRDRVVWVVGHRADADILAPAGESALVLSVERAA